jgi:alpha-galactosidase
MAYFILILVALCGATSVLAEELPAINGAHVFGVRPGAPVLITLATTGTKPLRFQSEQLPTGIILDPGTGRLTGSTTELGNHRLRVDVSNAAGTTSDTVELVVGEDLCLTPPMGWNSWYCMSESVNQAAVVAMAEAFAAHGLVEHGWTYINIDDCWQGARGGPFNALQGNSRFPDMKDMCDRIHRLGMKVGIYSTPWMASYAGFPGGSCWNPEGDYTARALPVTQRLQPAQLFGRYPGSKQLGLNQVGNTWFADADARQWAAWGVDYVKYDWHPIDAPTTARIAQGLRACGRDIALSLSNNLTLGEAEGITPLAQLWRTTGDIQDTWQSIREIGFAQHAWHAQARRGHWNDPDMLQVGLLGNPNQKNATGRPTRLTPDEQRTQMSLWALLAAPLILSCDVRQLDDFTRSLLTNDEVIAIDQDSLGQAGQQLVVQASGGQIWSRTLAGRDGRTTLAAGLFNPTDRAQKIGVTLHELGLTGTVTVRDCWHRVDLSPTNREIRAMVPAHGVSLFRLESAP